MRRPRVKWIAVSVLFLAAMFSVAEGREWTAGANAVEESDSAFAHGDARLAIANARTAAEAAVPFSPYPSEGYRRLESIAESAEQKGDLDLAGFAWRAMRSAAVSTRPAGASWGRVAEADGRLERLARASHTASLVFDESPSPWTSLLLTLGALALASGIVVLARKVGPRLAASLPVA